METYIKEYNKLNKNIEIYDSIFQPFIEYMEEKHYNSVIKLHFKISKNSIVIPNLFRNLFYNKNFRC